MMYYASIIFCINLYGCEVYTDYTAYKSNISCIQALNKLSDKLIESGINSNNYNFQSNDVFLSYGCLKTFRKYSDKEIRKRVYIKFGPHKTVEL